MRDLDVKPSPLRDLDIKWYYQIISEKGSISPEIKIKCFQVCGINRSFNSSRSLELIGTSRKKRKISLVLFTKKI